MTDRYNTPAPPPDALAARFVLGIASTENVPWWAAQWLADGCDGPALRELAGLNNRDPHKVNDLLPAALAEMGIKMPSGTVAAAGEAFRQVFHGAVSDVESFETTYETVDAQDGGRRKRCFIGVRL